MAGRTVDQGVNMLTAGEIRVAVLPVGPVPRDILDDYLELISRYHRVSLSAARPFYRESAASQAAAAGGGGAGGAGKTPFQFMDWSNSYMHLRFLQSEDARRRTRLADLHPGRQVLAILGVVYCPMCSSVQQAYDEFKKICRLYPEAFVTRCFVFEPSEDHIRQERECQQLADLVMFPPGGPSHLEQHLEVWMHDLAAALLTEFENWMLAATPSLMKLNSYADSAEFTGASPVLDEMQKRLASVDGEMREKQRWGRLMKMKGDMCLLCGSPRDAAEHYRTGQEIAKACSDLVWFGATLEGIATARLHEVVSGAAGAAAGEGAGGAGSGVPSGSTGRGRFTAVVRGKEGGRAGGSGFMTVAKWDLVRRSDTETLVRECFADARAAYKKKGGVAALQIEQHLKLARLVAGLRGGAARREVAELAAAVNDLLPFLPAAEDRIVAIVECAQVLGMVGCRRKRTLLLWHAMEQARMAGSDKGDLLRIAVRALEPPEDPQAQDVDEGPRTHWSVSRAISRSAARMSCGWRAVSTVVLEAALAAAKQAHAPAEAWELAATLLREHHGVLAPQYQAALLETMAQASAALPSRHRTRPGLGPGPVVLLKRVLPAALPLQPVPLTLTAAGTIAAAGLASGRGKSGASGPFIFNPYAAKRQAKQEAGEANNTPDWACGDEGRVEIYLVNPLSVPLKIDQLKLHVKYLGPPGTTYTATAGSAAAGGGGGGGLVRGGSGRQLPASSATASGTATPAQCGSAAAAAAAAAAASKAFKTPALNMPLAPNGRPHRAILCGKPQFPGAYSIEGCLVTMWGATWQVPFAAPMKRIATAGRAPGSSSASTSQTAVATAGGRGGGGGAGAPQVQMSGSGGAAVPACRIVCVNVLPQLPLVKAVIRASPCAAAMAASPQPGLTPQPSLPTSSGGSVSSAPPAQQQHQQQQPQPQISQPASLSLQDSAVVAISPRDDDIHATSAQTAFSEDLQRSPPVAVFEGQRLSWSLALHNMGQLPVTALSVLVTNHKGVALKPLRGSPLPASFQGVHLEADDAALQPAPQPQPPTSPTSRRVTAGLGSPGGAAAARSSSGGGGGDSGGDGGGGGSGSGSGGGGGSALPLRSGCVVTLPLMLAVGQAPRGTFREVSLEVTVSYLTKPSDRPDALDESAQLLGRRMTINLTFNIQPSLAIASTVFLDHFAPLLNGRRVAADRPIDVRLTAGGAAGVAAAAHGGGVGGDGGDGGDDESDSLNDGVAPRSTSNIMDLSLSQVSRPCLGSTLINTGRGGAGYGTASTASSLSLQHLSGLAPGSGVGSLSARLAGLDLSLGIGALSGRPGAGMPHNSLHSALGLPVSPSGSSAPPWLILDPREGVASFSTQGSAPNVLGSLVPSMVLTEMATAAIGLSAMLQPEGPDDALGSATDSVLCVAVRNTSNYYFRTWLTRLDDSSGSPPLLTAAAATAANCPIEVLQPGDTARLACVLPSVALGCVVRLQDENTTASTASATATAAAAASSASEAEAGEGVVGAVAEERNTSAVGAGGGGAPGLAASAAAAAGTSLRRVKLTVNPPGGGAGVDAHSTTVVTAGGVGGCDGPSATTGTRLSIAGVGGAAAAAGGGGGGAELAEEGDRMAAAEALAEDWAVVWELVTGLSEAAAGRAPPRGMVRLAAVDIARSLSTTAVHALRPSTIHFQFQALAPAPATCGSMPRLKDLTYRLQTLGLLPPHTAGAVWGLRAQMGEVLRCELLIHNSGSHRHRLTFSLAAVNSASCAAPSDPYFHIHSHHHHSQGLGQGSGLDGHGYSQAGPAHGLVAGQGLHGHAASFAHVGSAVPYGGSAAPYGAPFTRHSQPHHRSPHSLDGYASGGSLTLGGGCGGGAAGLSSNRAGSSGFAGGDLRGGSAGGAHSAAAAERGIDPGVVIIGAVQNVHVAVEPRSTARHPFALTFAHPGLYQLSVYDVCVVPEGQDADLWAGRPDQLPTPQRIYASVDRLNVLCT